MDGGRNGKPILFYLYRYKSLTIEAFLKRLHTKREYIHHYSFGLPSEQTAIQICYIAVTEIYGSAGYREKEQRGFEVNLKSGVPQLPRDTNFSVGRVSPALYYISYKLNGQMTSQILHSYFQLESHSQSTSLLFASRL